MLGIFFLYFFLNFQFFRSEMALLSRIMDNLHIRLLYYMVGSIQYHLDTVCVMVLAWNLVKIDQKNPLGNTF